MRTLPRVSYIIFLYFTASCIKEFSFALDTISTSQNLNDGESLVSAGGIFELGFFSSGNPGNRYLAIWYKNIHNGTVVWIANRDAPLLDSSGILKITSQRGLILVNGNGSEIWSSNMSASVSNPVAQLLDSGNLVIHDASGSSDGFVWQSFDYPTDTLVAGMKLGINWTSGFNRCLTASKGDNDPSSGNFTLLINPNGYPQLFLMQGSSIWLRVGSWNGIRFNGSPNLSPNKYYKYEFILNNQEIYYHYKDLSKTVHSKFILTSDGNLQREIFSIGAQSWSPYLSATRDTCDTYGLCGDYGSCNYYSSPVCRCLEGFIPVSPREWNAINFTSGCSRRVPLDCFRDIFVTYSGIRLPDTRKSWYNKSMDPKDCELACKRNCSCMAYANMYITDGGSGCLLWFGPLIDIREYNENGQEIHIRMAKSESGRQWTNKIEKRIILSSVLSSSMVLLLCLVLVLYIRQKKRNKRSLMKGVKESNLAVVAETTEYHKEELELPFFDLATIAIATDDFSDTNKIGEGGFGPVYRGMLKNGQEIAVKKLSRNSKQGMDEFKNEVQYIAKLQHRNLVKLLGYCIGEDYLLIYEYMPNKSLDSFIFDENKKKLLDWNMRVNIINGIARGLMYLHQDSRLRIIHRDLKAGNILLDEDLNAKISDFGLARSFGANQSTMTTGRVAGTYGYMSPEYAVDGIYSVKSDVFSFGVLLLEIVSGKRNRGFHYKNHAFNLLGHAWQLFSQERSIELLDEVIINSYIKYEVLRSIHIGLLCVQQSPDDRPTMSTIVLMLASEIPLPPPKEPGFYIERKPFEGSIPANQLESINEISTTLLSGR